MIFAKIKILSFLNSRIYRKTKKKKRLRGILKIPIIMGR